MQLADYSSGRIFSFVWLWPWLLIYGPDNSWAKWTKCCLYISQVSQKFIERWQPYNSFSEVAYSWPWPLTYVPEVFIRWFPCHWLSTSEMWEMTMMTHRSHGTMNLIKQSNTKWHFFVSALCKVFAQTHCHYKPQEQITRSLLCISTTGSNDLERSDTKLEAPSFPIEYKIFCSTFYAIPYINRFRNDLSSI